MRNDEGQEVTITLSQKVLANATTRAAQRGISVGDLLAELIGLSVTDEHSYQPRESLDHPGRLRQRIQYAAVMCSPAGGSVQDAGCVENHPRPRA